MQGGFCTHVRQGKTCGFSGGAYIVVFSVSVAVLMFIAVAKQLDQVILVKYILQIVALYAGILIELSLLYLLYSFLEKTSYNSSLLISKATVNLLTISNRSDIL